MRLGIIRTARILAALLLVSPAAALADIPNGVFVFDFTGDNQIYDFGEFSDCDTLAAMGYTVTTCLDVDMAPDGKGKYAGTATLDFSGDLVGTLVAPAAGGAKGKGGGGGGKLKLKTEGILQFLGFMVPTKIGVSCSGLISPSGFLSTLCKVKVKIEGAGSATLEAVYDVQLNGGNWTITIDVAPLDAKKFEGTGMDSLGFSYTVSGKYNEKKGTSSVKAAGDKDTAGSGAKIQLKNLTDAGMAEAKYQVQGYKGATPVTAN